MNNELYIVVLSKGGAAPIYNGAYIYGVFNTLEEAKTKLKEVAIDFDYGQFDGDEKKWEPGYQSDEESVKWSDNFFDKDLRTAWINGASDNWQRVEIFMQGENGVWDRCFS